MSNCGARYSRKLVGRYELLIGHAMMIRAKNNQVIKVVSPVVATRANVMHVYNDIPSADHARAAEVFDSVKASRNPIVGSAKVGVILPRYIRKVSLFAFTKTMQPRTAFGAEPPLSRQVRFSIELRSAMLAAFRHAWTLAHFNRHCGQYLGVGLIRAKTGAVVTPISALGGFAIEGLATHRASQIAHLWLLSLRCAFARTESLAALRPLHGAWVPLELLTT